MERDLRSPSGTVERTASCGASPSLFMKRPPENRRIAQAAARMRPTIKRSAPTVRNSNPTRLGASADWASSFFIKGRGALVWAGGFSTVSCGDAVGDAGAESSVEGTGWADVEGV